MTEAYQYDPSRRSGRAPADTARSAPATRARRDDPTWRTGQWGMIALPGLGGGVLQHADRGVPVLPGPGHRRPDAGRGALAAAGDRHDDLPAVEQRDDPPGGAGAAAGDHAAFCLWWAATIVLGVVFLLGTAYEWRELIVRHHLTISRNLFGTTYYTLVGFHGLHVTGRAVMMLIVLGLALAAGDPASNRLGVELVSWYWHFVDGVWVVVFTVVYVFGR